MPDQPCVAVLQSDDSPLLEAVRRALGRQGIGFTVVELSVQQTRTRPGQKLLVDPADARRAGELAAKIVWRRSRIKQSQTLRPEGLKTRSEGGLLPDDGPMDLSDWGW